MKENALIIIGLAAVAALAILFTVPIDREMMQGDSIDQETSTSTTRTLPLPPSPSAPPPTNPSNPGGSVSFGCEPTGCSGQVCSDREVMTTCEFRAEYACFSKARCERQVNGKCGWTETAEFRQCLSNLSSAY